MCVCSLVLSMELVDRRMLLHRSWKQSYTHRALFCLPLKLCQLQLTFRFCSTLLCPASLSCDKLLQILFVILQVCGGQNTYLAYALKTDLCLISIQCHVLRGFPIRSCMYHRTHFRACLFLIFDMTNGLAVLFWPICLCEVAEIYFCYRRMSKENFFVSVQVRHAVRASL